ncbi:MAG: hypothetical protein IJJ40_06665 [Clostridia bacterium]|nr:hypothetical protein [Clostridia bacterium]
MAYIRIDLDEVKVAAKSIETYISAHKSKMNSIDNEIINLSLNWQGKDYVTVKDRWNEMNGSGSTSVKMLTDLQNYANYLYAVEKEYKNAQIKVSNIAHRLPKW